MARKWGLFLHRLQTLLGNQRRILLCLPLGLSLNYYLLLATTTALVCLFAYSGLAQVATNPVVNRATQCIQDSSPNSPIPEATVEQSARDSYATGLFQQAVEQFQQVAQSYQLQCAPLRQSLSLSNLSLAYQQLGQWDKATEAIEASLALVERGVDLDSSVNDSAARQSTLAQALDIRGNLELSRGQAEQSIATWERSTAIYRQLGEPERVLASQINQARALQTLGLYGRSLTVLQNALKAEDQPTRFLEETLKAAEADRLTNLRARLALPDAPVTIMGLRSLAEALQVSKDNLNQSQLVLNLAEELAKRLGSPEMAATYLSMGNMTRIQAQGQLQENYMTAAEAMAKLQPLPSQIQQILQDRQIKAARRFDTQTQQASAYYQQAVSLPQPTDPRAITLQLQAQLNRLSLSLDRQEWQKATDLMPQIERLLSNLPTSQATINARINLTRSLVRLGCRELTAPSCLPNSPLQVAQLLKVAYSEATELKDSQAESYALGFLGEIYERIQQFDEAESLTRRAFQKVSGGSVANFPYAVDDAEIACLWQAQLGRILKAQHKTDEAIAAYEEAVSILQKRLRLDVATSNISSRFSFRQNSEQPIHQELLDLLLQPAAPEQEQTNLQRAREVTASLLEAELTNFLREPCQVVTPQEIDRIVIDEAPNAAILYPIVLPDRLELIVKLPGQTELVHPAPIFIPREQVLSLTKQLQLNLEEDYTFEAVKQAAQQLYKLIIEPVEDRFAALNIDTLVFALDRQLQSIPMSVLFDGEQYLIDRYAVSEILGLSFNNPTPLKREEIKVLAAGLATMPDKLPQKIQQNFLALPNVIEELNQIGAENPLIDQRFTRKNFNLRLNEERFSVVHLATHGQFSFNSTDTFLLSFGDNPKIDANALGSLFRVRGQIRPDSIELLVLNACETAAGDDLATLGIAGTAVRAEARSAIASLWALGDAPSVDFTRELYKNLGQAEIEVKGSKVKGSKAQALRQAQLVLKQDPRYEHPRYWAPYVLAGNWL